MAYQPKSYKKFVATAATATLVASAIAPVAFADSSKFTDVTNKYKDAVDFVVSKGANGLTATTFGVDANIKRVDAAVLLVNVLGLDIESAPASGLTDVPQRAVKHINALKAAGITSGKTPTSFDPDAQITRGELAIWISKAFKLEGSNTTPFKDVSSNYTTAVSALVAAGITQGTSETTFGTTANAKRGDYAIFLQRAAGEVAAPADLAITSVTALDDTNKYLSIQFSQKISDVDAADITIEDAKTGNRYGVKEATLSKDGKSATIELFENKDNSQVLKSNTEYSVTVNVNGKILKSSFYDAAFAEARVLAYDVEDKKITAVTYNNAGEGTPGEPLTIKVPSNVEFDYQGALGELVRIWYNDDKELVKYQLSTESTVTDAVEIKKADEIKVLSTGKTVDVSDEIYNTGTDTQKFKFYLNGADVTADYKANFETNYKNKKYNYAKVGYNAAGEIEYVSAYNLDHYLVVDKVDGNDVVGIEGDNVGSFNAKDATIVKEGKVVKLEELEKGDVLFFSDAANGEDGFAVVYNKTVTGKIDTVYNDSIVVAGVTYDFVYDATEINKFNVQYGYPVFLNEDGELEKILSDEAEELQAGGDVTLYLDPAGNLVYVTGEIADVASNKLSAVLTDKVLYDEAYGKDRIQAEVLLQNGKTQLAELAVENLDAIIINGEKYKIDNKDTDSSNDEFVINITAGGVIELYTKLDVDNSGQHNSANKVNYGPAIDLNAVAGQLVTLHVDEDGNIEEVELYNSPSTEKGQVQSSDVLEAGDTYFVSTTGGSKRLKSNTVVFDATDVKNNDYDADDITITTWGEYKGSDIAAGATAIYNDDNEVIALIFTSTTSSDQILEEAVVTDVRENTDDKITQITAYVNGTKQTFAVNRLEDSVSKGDVVVLGFSKNNTDLVTDIYTVSELTAGSPTQDVTDKFGTGYVVEDLVVDRTVSANNFINGVSVGDKKVSFTNGSTYTLVSDGKVINRTNKNDIKVETLADLRDQDIKVTVILDEKGGKFAKYFIFEDISSAEYNELLAPALAKANAISKVASAEDAVAAVVTSATKENIDVAETAITTAQTAVNAITDVTTRNELQSDLNDAKATGATAVDVVFTATANTSTSVKLTYGTTDVTTFTVGASADVSVAYATTGLFAVAANGAVTGNNNTTADSVVITVTDNFWGVSDTVTIEDDASDVIVVKAD